MHIFFCPKLERNTCFPLKFIFWLVFLRRIAKQLVRNTSVWANSSFLLDFVGVIRTNWSENVDFAQQWCVAWVFSPCATKTQSKKIVPAQNEFSFCFGKQLYRNHIPGGIKFKVCMSEDAGSVGLWALLLIAAEEEEWEVQQAASKPESRQKHPEGQDVGGKLKLPQTHPIISRGVGKAITFSTILPFSINLRFWISAGWHRKNSTGGWMNLGCSPKNAIP